MSNGRILVVDDDDVIRSMLKLYLEADYDVVCADNSIEGFRLAQFETFDLFLLDIQMPIFDGQDLCESLQENPETKDIPIIFITALTTTEDQVKCFQAGASDYVCKPLIEEIVKARVKVHIELKKQRDHLRQLTTTDPLTGVANRRSFDETFDREWRRCQRESEPLSMLAVEIDFFKRYNDHYGNTAGDDCLVELAQLLTKVVNRGGDYLARIRDEKFVALLSNTPHQSLELLAEKFRSTVEAAQVPHERSPTSKVVTISIGAASLVPDRQLKPTELYDQAFKQLALSSEKGGNKSTIL